LNFFSLFKRKVYYFFKFKTNIDIIKNDKSSLEDLFSYFGTDKADFIDNKKSHGYTKFYLWHLKNLKNKKINILEIGSFSGASAAAFAKFFKKAKVFCLDINISNFKYYSKKIKVYGLDACNQNDAEKFFKDNNIKNNKPFFDIIIDDGSHNLTDMLIAFRIFFEKLKSNGFYIIEEYKFPNYYDHLNDHNEITINKFYKKILDKKLFKSKILNYSFQKIIFNQIKKVYPHTGNDKKAGIIFFNKK
jgi:predicted O-methyltransferase YrrM